MPDLTIVRGADQDLPITNILAKDGTAFVLAGSDVLRWTAKRYAGQTDADALFSKTSADGGITFTAGSSAAQVHLNPIDSATVPYRDTSFVWDLRITPLGDVTKTVPIASGDGLIEANISRTAP